VLLLVVVSYLALTPKPLEGFESGLDKVAHLLAFTSLAFSGYLGFLHSEAYAPPWSSGCLPTVA